MIKQEITAIELARQSHIPYASIRNYINNRTCPDSERIYQIAKALDLKASAFVALGED